MYLGLFIQLQLKICTNADRSVKIWYEKGHCAPPLNPHFNLHAPSSDSLKPLLRLNFLRQSPVFLTQTPTHQPITEPYPPVDSGHAGSPPLWAALQHAKSRVTVNGHNCVPMLTS
jgi:hypothetical protein